jgi:uncharacterized heparinase superfamily protein
MNRLWKFLTLPLSYIIPTIIRKLFWPWHTLARFILDRLRGTAVSNQSFMRALDNQYASLEILKSHLANREQPCFFFDQEDLDSIISEVELLEPGAHSRIVSKANDVCDHNFDLLGSGPTFLGEEIDWHLDFKSGHRWKQTYYAFIKPAPSPGGFDIKVPWELNRCQHFIWLGQAYLLTQDEKYAEEFQRQLMHWVEENPPKFGVNWACTMDVAIRIINWIWAFFLLKDSYRLSEGFYQTFFKSLLSHGRFILDNLESHRTPKGKFTANHYLANIVGLLYLGILFPEFKQAQEWRHFGLQELEGEIFRQVYPDGFNFESSTSYHRLVLEMFLSAVILARANDISFSEPFMQRLEKMIEVVLHMGKPDGTFPLIGDQDNGRLHRLKVWQDPQKEWTDFRYLLAIGSVLFDRHDFAIAAGDQWQEATWLLGQEAITYKKHSSSDFPSRSIPQSIQFPDAGICVMHAKDTYLAVDAGRNGQSGIGGHAHNDLLSFELYSQGHTWIIDPGTYVYTLNYDDRRKFQSTAYHNTILVDEKEINRFDPGTLFGFRDDASIHINHWITNDEFTLLDAEHDGFARLKEPILHRRQILLEKDQGHCLIKDKLLGEGVHQIQSNLHLGLGSYQIQYLDPITVQFVHPKGMALIIFPVMGEGLDLTISEGWVSRSYGQRETAPILTHFQTTKTPKTIATLFFCQSTAETIAVDRLMTVGEELLSKMTALVSVEQP